MKILAVCGNGMGTSSMIKMKIDKIAKEMGLNAKVEHASLSEGKTKAVEFDVIFCSMAFLPNLVDLEKKGIAVIGVRNLMSDAELREKFQLYLDKAHAQL